MADSRLSNSAIERELGVTLTPEELAIEANGSDLFSVKDLVESYSQIELAESSRQITVVSTHLGPMRYKRLTMGINAASEIFQRALKDALAGLKGVRNLCECNLSKKLKRQKMLVRQLDLSVLPCFASARFLSSQQLPSLFDI